LQVECGAQQVNMMKQMFKDMQLSKDSQNDFLAHIQSTRNSLAGVDFSAEILTNGTWPQMETPTCQLPPQLKTCVDRFDFWFKQKNANRVLTWLFAHGQVELQTNYTADKKYQFIVNTFQAAILCLFNEVDEITCKEITTRCQITSEQFKACMMKLCDPKLKVLNKEVNKPVFDANEKIRVNEKFKSAAVRNNLIPQKVVKKKTTEATAEESQQAKQVAKERTFVIQAHIVKVMKAQKQYRYQNVVTDIIRNITMFKADPKMVKEQIEVLIRDEYMKRDENDKANLIYLP